jgi:hypothetical protein
VKPLAVACLIVVSFAALLVAGCGGGGSSAGSSSTTSKPPTVNPGGRAKKAKAPNAPAGSKATPCPGGGTGVAGVRAVAMGCGEARAAVKRWQGNPACRVGKGGSRSSCSLGAYRCQAISVERGAVVSCARPDGSDVSFIARPSAN